MKSPFKGLDVVKVSLDYLDAFGDPRLGCLGGGIASYTAEGVVWIFSEGVSHGAALEGGRSGAETGWTRRSAYLDAGDAYDDSEFRHVSDWRLYLGSLGVSYSCKLSDTIAISDES